ncbi:MAG: shikimate dehydrogenase [Methylobacteriaceae bacterium]|nr:shikimate dehydrogenase [Methylobacteriaceae bacterium]
MTARAFVVGHPIAHSRSPLIHGHWLAEHGMAGSYERLDVLPEAFPAFLRGLAEAGWRGGNVTIPHKEAAARLVDRPTDHARRLGSVNTVWVESDGRIAGDSTDGAGFLAGLDAALGSSWSAEAGTALVLGAGGAARAVAMALVERGIERVLVANRTAERAADLARLAPDRIGALAVADLPGALAQANLLVNTTRLGMPGEPALPVSLEALPEGAVVADCVYVPLETPLLAAARARGLRAVDGLGMLLHQAVPGFARWFGVRPRVTPALRARIVADLQASP